MVHILWGKRLTLKQSQTHVLALCSAASCHSAYVKQKWTEKQRTWINWKYKTLPAESLCWKELSNGHWKKTCELFIQVWCTSCRRKTRAPLWTAQWLTRSKCYLEQTVPKYKEKQKTIQQLQTRKNTMTFWKLVVWSYQQECCAWWPQRTV